nr:Ferredoxin and [2Fe-2S]-binding and Molybdopterin dehydrogenase and CO dehydrogenase flavoprotein and Aldehyde oxidase xanthine dehydrogenase and Aldehyde oxidase and xanthine dehydrogenase domain containing protein [Haemonchus contortus]
MVTPNNVDDVTSYDHNTLIFYVNGHRVEETGIDPKTTLAVYLRDHLHLTGTKIGCNEGGCGACTVMISEINPINNEIRHYSANSCLMPVCAVFGKAVTTVEGIGSVVSKKLHPVQERLAMTHGSQCGFCTPGFVMAMYALLRNNPTPTVADVNEALQGNLCRCTGYRPILEAFYSFTVNENGDMKVTESNGCGMGDKCCKVNKISCSNGETNGCQSNGKVSNGNDTEEEEIRKYRQEKLKLTDLSHMAAYDPSQELIFPPELKVKSLHKSSFAYHHHETTWYQPKTFRDLLELKRLHPYARFISGNSELAIELKFRFIELKIVINPRQVPDLHEVRLDDDGAYMGTALSLTEVDNYLVKYMGSLPDERCGVFRAVHEIMHWFAGKHVRNVASIAGNIVTASPISDLNPIWMAAGAKVVLESNERGVRSPVIDEHFFLAYRRAAVEADEVVKAVVIPFTRKNQYFRVYKQAQRREDDIAIVTGAFNAVVDPKTLILEEIRISFGGMAPTTKLALNTMKHLKGKKWSRSLLDEGIEHIAKEFVLPAGVPGGMARYRQALTLSFFMKFFLEVAEALDIKNVDNRHEITSIGQDVPEGLIATQLYQEVPADQKLHDPVGRAIAHVSGRKHVTGEAIYCDDVQVANCLHMAFVMSPIACGTLESKDFSEALSMDGVVGYIDAEDVLKGIQIGHHNDTPVFVKDKITYHGQPIAAIIAQDHETARRAANAVKLEYTRDKPIISIEDAIKADSYLMQPLVIHSSLLENETVVKNDWSSYDHVIEGEINMGGQEHFYLETQQCVVIPHEDDELEIISSSQGINDVQMEVSKCLGIPAHKIIVKVKRIGGGFGGKENACSLLSVPTAIAARKFRKPVRLTLERFDDMAISGTRHPFKFNYKVALDSSGKFRDYSVTAYGNCGHTFDLSLGVVQRAMVHIDNVYKFPNADIEGRLCKTNLASNTAFRGFGGPQGMFCTETLVKHIAEELNLDHDKIREINMYEEGDCTPFGMHLRQCNIRRTWYECKETSNYEQRLKLVREFNRSNKYRKRGIYMMPTRFGIGFGLKQLNQAGALVLIYTDGSVLVSHGGMEMGQGLHTKIMQIAARVLDIPIELVHIHDTATDKVPNASPTAASVGSDMNGLAVQDACNKLLRRLEPFKKANPEGTWKEWVRQAYVERVSLSATGFGIIHSETVDFFNGKGAELFGYCVYGSACCEVEVDCLTGDHYLLRTDIVMDIGDSLNPAIDIGQIEGAFVQGYGLFTMEEIKVRPDGVRLSRGPGVYKIPSADDAPRHFNVRLLKGSSNRMGIFSSKAVGEPPLFLGACAFFAIREAVRSFRLEHGLKGYFRFDSPATPEQIRLACEDEILSKVPELPPKGTYTPWTVTL